MNYLAIPSVAILPLPHCHCHLISDVTSLAINPLSLHHFPSIAIIPVLSHHFPSLSINSVTSLLPSFLWHFSTFHFEIGDYNTSLAINPHQFPF
jgi:hypothetical protein